MSRLLVIDNGVESDAFRWYLQAKEVDLEVVKDAAAGFQEAVNSLPRTVIVSSAFGIDYIERLVKAIRSTANGRSSRVIALIDSGDSAESLGADAIIMRPFHLEQVYQVIRDQDHKLTC